MKFRFPLKILSVVMCCMIMMCALPDMAMLSASAASEASQGIIRVRISKASSLTKIVVLSRGNYSVEGDASRALTSGQKAEIFIQNGELNITLNGATYAMGSRFTLKRHAPDEITNALSFTTPSLSRYFPGDMEFIVSGGKIITVNHVFMEDYLRGVLESEWSESGHQIESQKAMAIMARTEARRYMSKPYNSNYDILNTSSHQNYNGVVPSHAQTAAAVSSTNGVIVRYNGTLIEGTYGASNGGQIEVSENWWGGSARPYNVVKDDPYDYKNPSSPKRTLTVPEYPASSGSMKTALNTMLINAVSAKLDSVVYSTDAAGISIYQVKNVYPHTVLYPAPSRKYTKMRFSLIVNATRLDTGAVERVDGAIDIDLDIYSQLDTSDMGMSIQSSHNELYEVTRDGGNFVITARRWGHGIGYSQYGGEQMAREGFKWKEILDFYNNNKVTYPAEIFSRPNLTALGEVTPTGEPEVTPKPTAYPGSTLYPVPVQATVNTATLNMRTNPNSTSTIMKQLNRGTILAAVGTYGDWTFVEYGGLMGYVSTQYILISSTPTATTDPGVTYAPTPSPEPTPTPIVVPDDGRYMQVSGSGSVNLRSGPGTNYPSLTMLGKGTLVKVIGSSGAWSHVIYNGLEGYVSSSLLTSVNTVTANPNQTATPAITPSQTNTPAPTGGTTGYRNAIVNCQTSLNVRKEPGGVKIGELKANAGIQVVSESGGWARIVYAGGYGYVSSQYIKYTDAAATDTPSTAPTNAPTAAPTATATTYRTAYVKCETSLNVRAAASTGATKIGTLKNGAAIKVISEANGWACIVYGSEIGYVNAAYITYQGGATSAPTENVTAKPTQTAKPDTGTSWNAMLTCSNSMYIRQLPTTQSSYLGTVKNGSIVTVHSTGNGADGLWANITYNQMTGYVKTQYLKRVDGSATSAPTATPTSAPTDAPQNTYIPGVTTKGRVTASELNIRVTASESAQVLYTLKRGAEVEIVDITATQKWYYVRYGEYEGYCAAQYIMPYQSAGSLAEAVSGAEMFSMADATAQIICELNPGEIVSVLDDGEGWAYVETIDEQKGYVLSGELAG